MTAAINSATNKTIIAISQGADYLPIVASISNIAQAILKTIIIIAKLKPTSPYFQIISEKSYLELFLKFLPILGQYYTFTEASLTSSIINLPPQSIQNVIIQKMLARQITLNSLPFYLVNSRSFVLKAAKAGCDVSFSKLFQKDYQIYIECIKHHHTTFSKPTSKAFVNSPEIQAYIKANLSILKYAPSDLHVTADVLKQAITHLSGDDLFNLVVKHQNLLIGMHAPIPQDHLINALKRSYKIIQLIPKASQTKVQVDAAIGNNGLAIKFVAARYQNDIAIISSAVKQNPLALEFVNVDLVPQMLFEECVNKNPLAWAFGSLTHQRDIELRLKAVIMNPKSDIRLFRIHAGSKEDMIVELAGILFQENPYAIFSIPFPYCVNSRVLDALIKKCPADQRAPVMLQIQRAIPDSFKLHLRNHNPGIYAMLTHECLLADMQNLSGACVKLDLEENEDSAFGYTMDANYRRLNTEFMTQQQAVHVTGRWTPSSAARWQDAFDIMLANASSYEKTTIISKRDSFIRELAFFASAQQGSETLRSYFKQGKVYLSQIAGYIQSNPSDKAVIRSLIDAFQVCAGGIMSQLAQLVECHCEFSGNPPLEYRIGKLTQRLAARSVQHCASKTYHGQIANDVHTINHLSERYQAFFLDPIVHDNFGHNVMGDAQDKAFFDVFNAQALLQEVYEEAKTSEAFKESLKAYVRHNPEDFLPDEADIEEAKAEEKDDVLQSITDLHAHLARYKEYQTHLASLPEKLRDIISQRMKEGGIKAMIERNLVADLKTLYGEDQTTIDAIKNEFFSYRVAVNPCSLALGQLQVSLNISKDEIIRRVETGDLTPERIDHIMDTLWSEAFREQGVGEFLQTCFDEDGHFTHDALIKILDSAEIFDVPAGY